MITNITRRSFLQTCGLATASSLLIPWKVLSLPHRTSEMTLLSRSALSMGSILQITLYGESRSHCYDACEKAFAEFHRIERLMSVFDERSQLSLVNRVGWTKEVRVDGRIIEVMDAAKHYSQLTDSAFDVTIEPLMELYGFRDEKSPHHFPSDRQIAETLNSIGMKNITLNYPLSTINFEHPRTRIDLGGIAVGYAIDRAVNILKSCDVESAIINHSGDIYALGTPPHEDGWEVGITNPMNPNDIVTSVRIRDQALSTSGNYRNFIEKDGHRIGHILNPRTGWTASDVLSCTVIAPTAIEADALSTGCFVLGLEKSAGIITSNRQLIAISRDGTLRRL